MGIQAWAPWRQWHGSNATSGDNPAEGMCVFAIPVMQQVSVGLEETPAIHRHVPGNLLHPDFSGVTRDPGDFHATTLNMYKEL